MSEPSFTPILDRRTSAQRPRDGAIKVPHGWYREFLGTNPASILNGWGGLGLQGRAKRAKRYFDYGLKADVIDKICRSDQYIVKRILNLVLAFEDNLLFADPEWFPVIYRSRPYLRFMRWVISTEIHRPGQAVAEWKDFVKIVKWKAVQSSTEEPDLPKGFIGISRKPQSIRTLKIGSFWSYLAPWLVPIWNDGLSTKFECTRLAHFVTSRNMPAAGIKSREQALEDHFDLLTSEGPDKPDRREWLFNAAKYFGSKLRDFRDSSLKGAHLSVTNSASYSTAIKDGGRGTEVAYSFRKWASEIQQEDTERITWFGQRYWTLKGVARWRTMCRPSLAEEGLPGDSAYMADVDFTPGKFRYEDPIYCLNQYTGYQLLQWSIEEGIRTGALVGSVYRSAEGIRPGRYPKIRASAIGEPGNKSRVVTIGEGWLTVLLQPYAHALIDILRGDPDAKAGLSRSWQGFEFVKRWASRDVLPASDERFILSSDLKTATDYCPHGYAKALLKGFITGLGFNTPFTELWADLVTSPRLYWKDGREYQTKRGVLMGDPGSKVVLSLFNRVAEYEANVRFNFGPAVRMTGKFLSRQLTHRGIVPNRFRLFAYAGDDHISIGPKRYLEEITRSHTRNGMMVSKSSNFISKIAGFYCEEVLFIRTPQVWEYWGSRIPLYKQPYEENPHVDALKLRLLSLAQKEHEGKNETNPAIGMSSTLRGMAAWFSEGWESTRGILSMRFRQKMRGLIPRNPVLAALPKELGGVECPVFDIPDIELLDAWDRIPELHQKLITLVYKQSQETDQAFRRMLSQVSSMSAIRGVNPDSIEESIREILSSELCEARKLDEFKTLLGFEDLAWDQLRFRDKISIIGRNTEYISVSNAIQAVMRPYIFRDILFPEESLKHGINPLRTRAYAKLHWDRRFNRLYQAVEDLISKSDKARGQLNAITDQDVSEVRDTAVQALIEQKQPDILRDVVFIPRRVVFTDTLCTLQTPDLH
nr:RNA-dependent RNA polymerase [Narnavirus sp.]